MNRMILRHQKYKALHRILTDYPQAFENRPEAQAWIETLAERNTSVSALITTIIRPVSTVYRPKQELRKALQDELNALLGVAVIIATQAGNQSQLAEMKGYRREVYSESAYKLFEMAIHVASEIGKAQELAAKLGCDAQRLADFNTLAADYGSVMDDTGLTLNGRKANRKSIHAMLTDCNQLLINQVDHYIRANKALYPDLYLNYTVMRFPHRKRRGAAVKPSEGDISGTVANAATGLPVLNATLTLVQQASSTASDEDGCYLFDELAEGTYTLQCFAHGYQVPKPEKFNLLNGESLVIDFNLTPVDPVLN